jgi:hypothetical protein
LDAIGASRRSGIGGKAPTFASGVAVASSRSMNRDEARADVATQRDDRWHVRIVRLQRRLYAVFARNVVRAARLGAGRRTPQDQIAVRIFQSVGPVRRAAAELRDLRRAFQFDALTSQPCIDGWGVE